MTNKFLVMVASMLLFPGSSLSQSHCLKNETIILNAEVGKLDKNKDFQPNGKILSLCADRNKEPFLQLAYRYGKIGGIELEERFSESKKVDLHVEIDQYPHDKIQYSYSFSFYRGKIKYQVSKRIGWMEDAMGDLIVSQNEKILARFSFQIDDENLLLIDQNKPKSKLFKLQ